MQTLQLFEVLEQSCLRSQFNSKQVYCSRPLGLVPNSPCVSHTVKARLFLSFNMPIRTLKQVRFRETLNAIMDRWATLMG